MKRALQSGFRTEFKRAGAAALMAAIASLGFALPWTPAQAAGPEVTKLDFWAVRDAQESAQITLASEKGFFKDEGLDVTVKWIVSGTDTPSLAASGQILLTGESVYIAGVLQEKGVDMRYLMPMSNIGGSQQVVLGPKTVVNSPKDLEGKKIGMAAGAGVGMAITSMCEEYKVDCSKITLVNLQPPDQIPALLRGDIDAMAIWNPYALAGVKAGGRLYFSGNKSYIDGAEKTVDYMYLDGGLIVNGPFATKNPETVKAVMRALIKATDYITLANDPEIILMDEPFGALDPYTREALQDQLIELWSASRKTILFVTHSVEEAAYLAGVVILLKAHPGELKAVVKNEVAWPRERASEELIGIERAIRRVERT